jgi:HNH endonuclease
MDDPISLLQSTDLDGTRSEAGGVARRGESGDVAPHFLAGEALITLRALYRLHGQLAQLEGDHLELLLRKRWYKRFGYESFRDFAREELQTPYRTATRRAALSRLLRESPELAAALREGRLGPCQVLALSRLRDAPDLPSWITIAEDSTVRDLEPLVATYLKGISTDEAASDELDEPGRRVVFAAPVSAAVIWEHGLDMAQRVLGWQAPPFRCVEMVLAESAAELGADSSKLQRSSREAAWEEESRGDFPSSELRYPSPEPKVLQVTRQQLNTLLHSIWAAREEIQETVAIAAPCEDDPDRSVEALSALKRKDRGLRLLFVRLLRDTDAAHGIEFLGHESITEFLVSRLKMSRRTAARVMSEAWTFHGNSDLARAFASGRIGLGQAYLVNRLTDASHARFIHRAEQLTHLQFEREVRFLERLADFVPDVAKKFPGPLPLPGLGDALKQWLRDLGWAEVSIEACAGSYDGNPAEDAVLMARLEGLLNLVAVAFEEHDRKLYQKHGFLAEVPTLATGTPGPPHELDSAVMPMLATLPPSERTTISFWAPESLIKQWNLAIARVQSLHGPLPIWAAALFLMQRAVSEWERVDPSRRPATWKILERDEWRCQAPGCSSRRGLEVHHIVFRSQNGSNDPENLVTLCHGHHRRGIHDGYLAVRGTAPGGLHWRLGGGKPRPNGLPRPMRAFHGSRLVRDHPRAAASCG